MPSGSSTRRARERVERRPAQALEDVAEEDDAEVAVDGLRPRLVGEVHRHDPLEVGGLALQLLVERRPPRQAAGVGEELAHAHPVLGRPREAGKNERHAGVEVEPALVDEHHGERGRDDHLRQAGEVVDRVGAHLSRARVVGEPPERPQVREPAARPTASTPPGNALRGDRAATSASDLPASGPRRGSPPPTGQAHCEEPAAPPGATVRAATPGVSRRSAARPRKACSRSAAGRRGLERLVGEERRTPRARLARQLHLLDEPRRGRGGTRRSRPRPAARAGRARAPPPAAAGTAGCPACRSSGTARRSRRSPASAASPGTSG